MKKIFLRMMVATRGQVLMYGYALITLVVMFVPNVISFFILTRNCNREDCLVGIGSIHYWPLFIVAGVFFFVCVFLPLLPLLRSHRKWFHVLFSVPYIFGVVWLIWLEISWRRMNMLDPAMSLLNALCVLFYVVICVCMNFLVEKTIVWVGRKILKSLSSSGPVSESNN